MKVRSKVEMVEEGTEAVEKIEHVENPLKDNQRLSSDCTCGALWRKSKVYAVFVYYTCRIQHRQFVKGVGCVKYRNLELGVQLRVQLDRQSDEYDLAYDDRTAAERINSQAKGLGIERPSA